jgi:DNA repair ATPase RecN
MLEEQIKQMENSVNSLKQHWESASRVLSQTNQQLSQSMEQFANHMHKGLEKTFKEFDKELANAVTYLERGVGTLHAVMSDWPDEMEKFASSVKTANEHLRSSVKEAGEQLARAVHEVDRRVKSLANS